MTTQQALAHYNNLTNNSVEIDNLRYLEDTSAAIKALVKCSQMVENAGGKLQSRQVMAAIIYFAEEQE
jgi:hypothetical protein